MGSSLNRKYHQTIIIPATDIVSEFIKNNGNINISKQDLDELMFQVINTLVNNETDQYADLETFPNVSRLRDINMTNNAAEIIEVQTIKLQVLIKQRLIDYGVYEDNTFSYFFLQFIGYDLILSYLPH